MNANHPTRLLTARTKAGAAALFAMFAASACSHTPTAQELNGRWATVPVVTARGTTSEEFCFAPDGSFEWDTRTPGGSAKHRGTFKLVGDTLTIQSDDFDAPPTMKALINLGKLELTSSKGTKSKYSKIAATCEESR